jgi:hypothetical protein
MSEHKHNDEQCPTQATRAYLQARLGHLLYTLSLRWKQHNHDLTWVTEAIAGRDSNGLTNTLVCSCTRSCYRSAARGWL